MRLASPPFFKTAVVYGLLAVASALPTSLNLEDEQRRSLDRRAFTPPLRPLRPVEPVPPVRPLNPADPPPHAPGGVRPGGDGPVRAPGGTPETPRLGTEPPKRTTEQAGKDNIAALDAKLQENPIKSNSFGNYDQIIKDKYTYDVYVPVSKYKANWYDDYQTTGKNWLKDNGIPIGDGTGKAPELKGIDIYGKKVDPEDPNLELMPVWAAELDTSSGVMSMARTGEFRTGKAGAIDSDALYDFPVNERIYTSEHIAKAWKDNGDGKPMTKNVVKGIVNPDMKDFLTTAIATKGKNNRVDLGPNDPEWATIMGGSIGSPLARALTDHPDVFHNHKPTGVSIFSDPDNGGSLSAVFTLAPGA